MSGSRTERTRDKLGDALIALLQEKPFDDITVQDVLDRAGVGRSTFYAHFKDKDDLLLSDAEQFLEWMASRLSRAGDKSRRVFPVRELFEHVGGERKLYESLAQSGRLHDFLALAEGVFARGIEARLREIEPSLPESAARALAFSGALLALMRQWLAQDRRRPAAEMDELFHSLVWRA
jgi:AcrR family transcriptional regulator